MPKGKAAGVRCVQLDEQSRCQLFGSPLRPAVCASLQPHPDMCGDNADHAVRWLTQLERSTRPVAVPQAGLG